MKEILDAFSKMLYQKDFKDNTLKTILNQQTVEKLKTIMMNLAYEEHYFQLSKNDLLELLNETLIKRLSQRLIYFNNNHLHLIMKIVNSKGKLEHTLFHPIYLDFLTSTALAFPYTYSKKYYLIMPLEVINIFFRPDIKELYEIADENIKIVRYAYGFSKIYGAFNIGYFTNKYNEFENTAYPESFIWNVLFYESLFNKHMTVQDNLVFHHKIKDKNLIIKNENMSINYYPFSKSEILKGEPNKTEDLTDLIRCLSQITHLNLTNSETKAKELIDILRQGYTIETAVDHFQKVIKIEYYSDLTKLKLCLKNILPTIRLYTLKGYKQVEL